MTGMATRPGVFTIGHSTHELGRFVGLLKQHQVGAVADVRSVPYSRRQPRFGRESLAMALKAHSIKYVFLGKELGARSDDPACCDEAGKVRFRRLAGTAPFHSGIQRVLDGSRHMRIALMCAEKDPLDCHRTLLVARELVGRGMAVNHILDTGEIETHQAAEKRLLGLHGRQEGDLFWSREEQRNAAYEAQERGIAYVDEERVREAQGARQCGS